MNLDGKIIDQMAMTARLIVRNEGPTLPELPANKVYDGYALGVFTRGATMSPELYERWWARLLREQAGRLAADLREHPNAKMGRG